MNIDINLDADEVSINDSDRDIMWDIITEDSDNFMYLAVNRIISILKNDYEYYSQYSDALYDAIRELQEEYK